jgi:hypothetical protein
MKQNAKTAGVVKTTPETKDSQVHPAVRWWPLQTPRLTGRPFASPVAKIPRADSPLTPGEVRTEPL